MPRITKVYMSVKSPPKAGTAIPTIRVPRNLRKRLDGLAGLKGANRSRLAIEALQIYIDEQESQLAKVDQGLRDADAGRMVPHAKVKCYLQSWGSRRPLPPPLWKYSGPNKRSRT